MVLYTSKVCVGKLLRFKEIKTPNGPYPFLGTLAVGKLLRFKEIKTQVQSVVVFQGQVGKLLRFKEIKTS